MVRVIRSLRSLTQRRPVTLGEVGTLSSAYPSGVVFSEDGRLVFLGDWKQGSLWSWDVLLGRMTANGASNTQTTGAAGIEPW
jgi:hypothetical protein